MKYLLMICIAIGLCFMTQSAEASSNLNNAIVKIEVAKAQYQRAVQQAKQNKNAANLRLVLQRALAYEKAAKQAQNQALQELVLLQNQQNVDEAVVVVKRQLDVIKQAVRDAVNAVKLAKANSGLSGIDFFIQFFRGLFNR